MYYYWLNLVKLLLLACAWSLVGDYGVHAQGREGESEICDIVGTPPVEGAGRAEACISTKERGTPHIQSAIICVILADFQTVWFVKNVTHIATRQGALVF